MTNEELIATQKLEIERLKKAHSNHQAALEKVHEMLFRDGGPLNNSDLGYTRQQMAEFWRIKEALGI